MPALGLELFAEPLSGTLVRNLDHPIANLAASGGDSRSQRVKLDAIARLNQLHKRDRAIDSQLDARIASFELAFRMQREAPEAFDIARESEVTKRLYGIGNPTTDLFGRQCLLPAGSRNGACVTSSSSTPRRTTPGTITAASAKTSRNAAPPLTGRFPLCCAT